MLYDGRIDVSEGVNVLLNHVDVLFVIIITFWK